MRMGTLEVEDVCKDEFLNSKSIGGLEPGGPAKGWSQGSEGLKRWVEKSVV